MLASLEATRSTPTDYEVILVDDGSTDGTRAWLETLPTSRFRVLLNERNVGYAISNNRAAAAARGQQLLLLNNDVVLLPGWLEPLRAAHRRLGIRAGVIGNVQRNARTGAIDHAGMTITLKGKPEHDHEWPNRWARLTRSVKIVPAVTAACALVDAALWRQLGGFDEGFVNGGEDVDLCFRARAAGRVNAVAVRSVVLHHVSSSAGRKRRDEENSCRLAQRWRREFIAEGVRAWSRRQAEAILAEPRNFEPKFAWRVWCHARGLSRTPPAEGVTALQRAMDVEFARWGDITGTALPAP